MRGLPTAMRAAAGCLAMIALTACENQVPTATGIDLFPEGTVPVSVELVLPRGQFLLSDTTYQDFSEEVDESYLLVANRFDGGLDARALARFTGFPDSLVYSSGGTTRTEKDFTYGTGRVVARVDSTNSAPRAPVVLRLYALEQAWDSAHVSWRNAVDRPGATPWRAPGGTLGALLAEGTWVPGDTVRKDSVVWQLDSLAVARMARPGFPGVAVVAATGNSRLQLSRLTLSTGVRPAGRRDTLIAQTFPTGPQTFIYTPDQPLGARFLRAGGTRSARTVLRLNLDQPVPACANPATTPNCPRVSLRSVTLNQAQLQLEPAAVPLGFRPLSRRTVQLRRVLEPELGRFSPLGEVIAEDTASASLFQAPGARTVTVDLTNAVLTAGNATELNLAVLTSSYADAFGVLWFTRSPRLRLVYTLPLRPTLP